MGHVDDLGHVMVAIKQSPAIHGGGGGGGLVLKHKQKKNDNCCSK